MKKQESPGFSRGEQVKMSTQRRERLLADVAEFNRHVWERELRARMAYALAAGLPETKVAEAAGISRVTLRAWMNRRWLVEWRGEEVEVKGREFDATQVAQSLTDLPVEIAGFDGTHADELEAGQSSVMEVHVAAAAGEKRRTLRFRVTRTD